ncbi:hypothetical protein BGX30_010373 [Mortierella sp. GBA39]|nr:hypothetical protein BGX30_010373 [Mortierella sp. GBA39]
MSEHPTVEQQYGLSGDPIYEADQAMEEVAIASDEEIDTPPSFDKKTISLDVDHADPYSEEKGSALNELKALLAASEEEEVVTNATLLDNEDSLAVLEKVYTAAEVKVGTLCNHAAKLVSAREKVDNWREPKRTRVLTLADKSLLENSIGLEEAQSAAQAALNRVKSLKATHRALLPASSLSAVPYDAALPFHAAIKRYFKMIDIPTDPTTGEVHCASAVSLPLDDISASSNAGGRIRDKRKRGQGGKWISM